MATNWPSSVQTFTNPTSGSSLSSPSHADQHATVNDTVEALQQYAGLVFIKSVTVGSGVTSVTVSNAFDSRFDFYQISVTNVTNSANQPSFRLTLGAGGSQHKTVGMYIGLGTSTITGYNLGPGTSFIIADMCAPSAASSYDVTIKNPYNAVRTTMSAQNCSTNWGSWYNGIEDANTSHTSFTLFPNTGTLTGGVIRVYGYNNGA